VADRRFPLPNAPIYGTSRNDVKPSRTPRPRNWMTLMQLGEKAETDKVLELNRPEMDIIENTSYHRRLPMYKGLETQIEIAVLIDWVKA
jgi:hypothetical protein